MTEWRAIMSEYEVSDDGQVRRGRRILRQSKREGYMRVCLSVKGRKSHNTVHRLVAQAFLGDPPEDRIVAHLSGNREDNRLVNLAYKTPSENESDKVRHGTSLHGARNHNAKLTDCDVAAIRAALAAGEMQTLIARRFSVSPSLVCKIKKGVVRVSIPIAGEL